MPGPTPADFRAAPVQYAINANTMVCGLAGGGAVPVRIPGSVFAAAGGGGSGTLPSGSQNLFLATPDGSAGVVSLRAIVPADLAGTPLAGYYWDGGTGLWTILPPAGTGTVTSVDVAVPSELSSTGGPVTTAGIITLAWNPAGQHLVFAGPSGSSGTPAFRALVASDIPALAYVTSVAMTVPTELSVAGSPITSSGTLALSWNSAGQHLVFAGPSGSSGTPAFRALVASDIPALAYVTSVALSLPVEFNVSGSPVTGSGTLTGAWASQSQNLFFASPNGSSGTPAFRAMVVADMAVGYLYSNLSGAPSSLPPSGAAGGDLTGTYPNPTIAALAVTDAKVATANKDGTAATPSMRTLGTGAQQAAAGNDTRFPASVTGLRKGAGAGSADTAAVAGTDYVGPTTGSAVQKANGAGGLTAAVLADIIASLGSQSANTILAGPTSGGAAAPSFRLAVAEDLGTGTPTAGFANVSAGAGTKPAWAFLNGTAIGFLAGKDRARPAASTLNIWKGTDSGVSYASDGTNWGPLIGGFDKSAIGQIATGFSDTNYALSPVGAAVGPPMLAAGSTFVFGFYVNSLPGTSAKVMYSYGLANITNGWLLRVSAANSNKLAALFKGINADANIEINQTLTTGPHVLAFNFNGSSIRSCLDGGTVVASAALSGTYVAPTASSSVNLGRYFGATGLSMDFADYIFLAGYATALSDGELQTASGNFAAYRLGNTTADPTYMHQNQWIRLEGTGSGVSVWPMFGTAAIRSAYLSPQGTGLNKANF